ncbi:hypothetical protein [Streptomyces sp. RKAG290]|uniref:hypothetical protein n=1 Tax=Streptomyces sp. RKAG290 TaxID=2888348 RepID=UPI0020332EC4|nr:hypothetical protein [Streptomyces sp. RKAG290]MCM2416479.1 hypothetical protein [Streptomyces sp. RKAG290]
MEEEPVKCFEAGETVVRRDVHRSGRVWSEQALRVLLDSTEALVTACPPGAQAVWPSLYAKARADGDPSVRTEAFDAMATGEWELGPGCGRRPSCCCGSRRQRGSASTPSSRPTG